MGKDELIDDFNRFKGAADDLSKHQGNPAIVAELRHKADCRAQAINMILKIRVKLCHSFVNRK